MVFFHEFKEWKKCDNKIKLQLSYTNRVRKARPGAERNFQLRVRRNGEGPETGLAQQPETEDDYDADLFNRSVRRTLLDQIRDRRFARRPNAENNFQLRVKRSA